MMRYMLSLEREDGLSDYRSMFVSGQNDSEENFMEKAKRRTVLWAKAFPKYRVVCEFYKQDGTHAYFNTEEITIIPSVVNCLRAMRTNNNVNTFQTFGKVSVWYDAARDTFEISTLTGYPLRSVSNHWDAANFVIDEQEKR